MSPDSLPAHDESFAHLPRPLRWLYLDLNSYFASVEQQLNPRLRGRPVIVSPIDTDTTCAIAASYEAKAYGIRTGTPVWQAKQICRDLVIVPAHHGRYVEFHHKIIEEVWRHIPVTHVCSIDEVACWLMDNENDPVAAHALALRIKAGIKRNVGIMLRCSIGIAPSKLAAKLGSNMQKPDGLTILTAEHLPERLYALKLRDITGIARNMERRLLRRGIYTVRDFCGLGPRKAGQVWGGRNGDRMWFLLHGYDLPEQPTTHRSIGHSNVLAPENRGLETAYKVARRLTFKAAARMRREGYRARRFILHARRADYGGWACQLKIALTDDSFQALSALEQLWPQLVAACTGLPRNNCLKGLGVVLADIVPDTVEQGDFFDTALALPVPPSIQLGLALDAINARFGRNAVMLGMPLGGRSDQVGTKIAFTRIPDLAEFHE
jgi:DNA polymerase-4